MSTMRNTKHQLLDQEVLSSYLHTKAGQYIILHLVSKHHSLTTIPFTEPNRLP
jgi:hypothetical protein